MKLIVLTIACLITANAFSSDDTSSIKSGIKSITSAITSSGKDALSGIKEGVDDGRSSGSSVDGAIIIYDKENLDKYVDIKILSSELVGDKKYLITSAIKNKSDSAIRLTNLSDRNNIFILDNDGFTAYLTNVQNDISIPKKSATKVRFEFVDVEGKPTFLRLYEGDIAIPAK